jgi:hypothetical protein
MKLQPPHQLEFEIPAHETLRGLSGRHGEMRVSVYLPLPRSPGFDEVRQVPQRYERAVEAAEARLDGLGVAAEEQRALLEPMRSAAVELAGMPPLARSIAIFGSQGGLRAFALPVKAEESVRVGRSLHLRPLLASARLEGTFRVLALATNQVALFDGDARGLRRVHGSGVPASLEDALGSELTDAALQMHSSAAHGGSPIFHGHGGASAERTVDRERFHRVLADRLQRLWSRRDDPLVLVADESHQGRFRKVSSLSGLLDAGLVGSPERMQVSELFERARAIVLEARAAADHQAAERAANALAHGAAVGTLEEAVAAAVAGRVLRLWLTPDARLEKHVEPDTGRLVDARGDEDAFDELAEIVLARGGYVLIDTDQSTGRAVVAELRG